MKNLAKYKWVILVYIVYAAFILLWLDEGLDLRHQEFWYGIIICYFAVPLIIYTAYYLVRYKIFNKSAEGIANNIIITVTSQKGYDKSWTLMDFARQHGKMKVHHDDDGLLDICIFTNADGVETTAYVAAPIKRYSVEDIQREKEELSVITLDSGAYCLCKKWEVVRL